MTLMLSPADPSIKLSVVVPCYNEEEVLPELLRRLLPVCETVSGGAYEIVIVNDSSKDKTWPMIVEASKDNKRIVGINLARNHGHQIGLTAGLSFTRGQRILVIDADLQDPPELLPDMWARMDDGVDVVYGQRRSRDGETAFKKETARLFYRLLDKLTDVKIPQDTGDFRLMSRRVLETLQSMPEQQRFIRGMVAWAGHRQEAFLYDRDKRFAGETKYPLNKMLKLALDAITSFSVKPLQLAYLLAFFTAFLAFVMLIWTLVIYFTQTTTPGWTSLMAVILGFGSMQMIVLAIFGEYLGRIYMEAKRRPLFLVRETTRDGGAS